MVAKRAVIVAQVTGSDALLGARSRRSVRAGAPVGTILHFAIDGPPGFDAPHPVPQRRRRRAHQ